MRGATIVVVDVLLPIFIVVSLIAAIGRPREAVRAAVVHVLFNVAGVVIWLGLIDQLAAFGDVEENGIRGPVEVVACPEGDGSAADRATGFPYFRIANRCTP